MIRSIALVIFCTLFSTWQYIVLSLVSCTGCPIEMQKIINFEATAPFAYRLLTPFILSLMGNSLQSIVLFQLLMLLCFYALFYLWCKRWKVSPFVVLPLTAMAMSIMFPTFYYSLYTIPEWNLWLIALLLLPHWWQSPHSTEK